MFFLYIKYNGWVYTDLQLALVAHSELELNLGQEQQRTTWILNEKGLERHVINK